MSLGRAWLRQEYAGTLFDGIDPACTNGEISGEVWLNGYRTTDVPMWQLAEKAGMVFQNPAAQMLKLIPPPWKMRPVSVGKRAGLNTTK
ncbi:MAG: hypothetical protein IPL17_17955 [Anaerolineales bacterium]|nr:hypothetical protein [Anaerolineales bacterium]